MDEHYLVAPLNPKKSAGIHLNYLLPHLHLALTRYHSARARTHIHAVEKRYILILLNFSPHLFSLSYLFDVIPSIYAWD